MDYSNKNQPPYTGSTLPYPVAPPPAYNEYPGSGPAQPMQQFAQFGTPTAGIYNPNYQGNSVASGVPPVGFFIPLTNPMHQQVPTTNPAHQQDSDDEPKYTNFHDDINGYNFSEKSIRLGFIRKVYSILSIQLGITVGFIALFLYHEGIKQWTRENPSFMFATLGVYIVTIIALACCEGIRRKAPQNFIFLSIFTLATSVLVGTISSTYSENTVLLAAGITVAIVVGLTIFSFQTKWDFTRFGGILFCMLFVFVLVGFMMIFLRSYFQPLRMVYAGLGALLFSAYLVHDTQLMIGGDHKYSISPEEYIFAALNLYLDIINIFLYILQILGRNN